MRRVMLILAVGLWFMGCEADDPCDKGQVHEQGSCVTKPSPKKDAASDDVPDAAMQSDSGSGGGQTCSESRDDTLGKQCTDDDGCNCAAPYCAKMPGAPMGTCTVFCTPSPDDCPDGYRCFDLSTLGVTGYRPFCIKK